jgi:hypothetical protein
MKLTQEQLKELILQEISLAKAGDEHYHDYEDEMDYEGGCGDHEPMMGPDIMIGYDDEPCGCPDMAHYHDNNEGAMARSQLMHMKGYAEALMHMIQDQSDLPEWVEKKITLANDYIAAVKHYLEGELAREQGMLENKSK